MSHADATRTVLEHAQTHATAGLSVPVNGIESIVVGALAALPSGAWWVPGPRESAGAVLRDVPADRPGDAYTGAKPYKVAPVSASPALRALHAVGLARASKGAVLVHLGAGSIADGAFAEALNLAVLLKAQVVFVVADLELDERAPVGRQSAASAESLAAAYGVPTQSVDGRDAAAVQSAVSKALGAGGPALINAFLSSPSGAAS